MHLENMEYSRQMTPTYNNQWYLNKTKVPYAWDIVHGNSCIIVAILDSGTDWLHEDLGNGSDNFNNIWHNPSEDAWSVYYDPTTGNGIDDDGNGFIDDWIGWDFANQDNNSRSTINSHGTQVSGIVSAKSNNNTGIAGLAGGNNSKGVMLMPLLIGETNPNSSVIDDAILYAVNNGAQVIQMSLGVPQSNAIDSAIQVAENANVTIVCAAGNNSSSTVDYPASNVNVIAVGSTNQNDQKSDFSNYGSNLFIAAPGEDIYSTTLFDNYVYGTGNSFAAPQVSATIALMKQINPIISNQQIRNVFQNTADKVGGYTYTNGRSNELGYGRLNVYNAVVAVSPYITGFSPVCTSSSTFTLRNRPSGTTVNWTNSSNLSYVSGQNTDNYTVKAAPLASDAGWVQATISGSCGDVTIRKDDFWVGNPGQPITDPSGYPTYQMSLGQIKAILVVSGPGLPYQYIWTVTGSIEKISEGDVHCTVEATTTGWGNFYVKSRNECGYSATGGGSVNVSSGGGGGVNPLSVSPNPANQTITVELKDTLATATTEKANEGFTVKLLNSYNKPVYQKKVKSKRFTINVSRYRAGIYYLQVIKGNKVYAEKVVITD